jgi:hypothetical protein
MANVKITGFVNEGGVTKNKTPNKTTDSLISECSILPATDTGMDLGTDTLKWNELYAVTGYVAVLNMVVRASDPPVVEDLGQIYTKDNSGSTEVFVQDDKGNVTQISPHNDDGEWQYFSRNVKTGKVVRINMERMIRRLEEITGESFMEEWYEEI